MSFNTGVTTGIIGCERKTKQLLSYRQTDQINCGHEVLKVETVLGSEDKDKALGDWCMNLKVHMTLMQHQSVPDALPSSRISHDAETSHS